MRRTLPNWGSRPQGRSRGKILFDGLAPGCEIAMGGGLKPETVLNQNLLRLPPRLHRIANKLFQERGRRVFPGLSGQAVDKLVQPIEIKGDFLLSRLRDSGGVTSSRQYCTAMRRQKPQALTLRQDDQVFAGKEKPGGMRRVWNAVVPKDGWSVVQSGAQRLDPRA
jgi:hypothetical protein